MSATLKTVNDHLKALNKLTKQLNEIHKKRQALELPKKTASDKLSKEEAGQRLEARLGMGMQDSATQDKDPQKWVIIRNTNLPSENSENQVSLWAWNNVSRTAGSVASSVSSSASALVSSAAASTASFVKGLASKTGF